MKRVRLLAVLTLALAGNPAVAEDRLEICRQIAAAANEAPRSADDMQSARNLLNLLPPGWQKLEPKPVGVSDLARLYGCENEKCGAPSLDQLMVLARGANATLVDTRPWSNQTFVMLSYPPAHRVVSCDNLFGFAQDGDNGWRSLDLPFSADDIGKTMDECDLGFVVFRLGDKPYLAANAKFPPYPLATLSSVKVIRSVFDTSALSTRQC